MKLECKTRMGVELFYKVEVLQQGLAVNYFPYHRLGNS